MQNQETKILDKGFVRLVDFMGGDKSVVGAARVSFGKDISDDDERDRKLIDFLMTNGHESPFEHSVFKFHIKCPLFVARQWFRHRIASYNEISGRYTKMSEEFYIPSEIRTQAGQNYQYDKLDGEVSQEIIAKIEQHYNDTFQKYQELLDQGVAKEQARIILPMGLYTQFYWTINLRSLMNFIKLRADEHAQYEIRVYAEAIKEMFKEKMPWSYEAFEKSYGKGANSFSEKAE